MITRYPDSPYAAEAKLKLKEMPRSARGPRILDRQVLPHLDGSARCRSAFAATARNYPDTDVAAAALAHFGKYFRKRGDLTRSALAYAALIAEYPQSPDALQAESALADLKAKKIDVPDPPLPALVESLGRPSMAVAPQPSAVPAQTAATVPTPESPPNSPARN